MSPLLRLIIAAIHLLSLALGVSANLARYLALRDPTDPERRKLLFAADNVAGIVSITWIGSGLWRAFGGLEKGTDYYLASSWFQVKLGLIGVALCLEIWPMVTFIRWRYAEKRGEPIDARRAPLFRKLIVGEMVATAGALVCASAMAQGFGAKIGGEGYQAVQSIVRARCVACHSTALSTASLDLSRDPRTALVGRRSSQWPELTLVVAGAPEASLLIHKVRGDGVRGSSMPPGGKLPEDELRLLEAWVRSGALP